MDHDTYKTIRLDRIGPSGRRHLGGTVRVLETVEIESREPFLDNYISFAISELSDKQKLKTMDFIQRLVKQKICFDEAFAYIFLISKDNAVRDLILSFSGMKEVITELKAKNIPQNKSELLEFIQENI